MMRIEKFEKLVSNLLDTTEYVILRRSHEFVLRKVYNESKSNQNAWLKTYILI